MGPRKTRSRVQTVRRTLKTTVAQLQSLEFFRGSPETRIANASARAGGGKAPFFASTSTLEVFSVFSGPLDPSDGRIGRLLSAPPENHIADR